MDDDDEKQMREIGYKRDDRGYYKKMRVRDFGGFDRDIRYSETIEGKRKIERENGSDYQSRCASIDFHAEEEIRKHRRELESKRKQRKLEANNRNREQLEKKCKKMIRDHKEKELEVIKNGNKI